MISNTDMSVGERWGKTRSGAWASRGFDYQHLFSVLVLVRQWARLAPEGHLVPEGLEDCVIELPDREVWVQIKSKHKGNFRPQEIDGFYEKIQHKSSPNNNRSKCLVVVLERPCSGIPRRDVEDLFSEEEKLVIVCPEPGQEIIHLLVKTLDITETVAEMLLGDLYQLVVESAKKNASSSFEKRRYLSTTQTAHRIVERLEATDPSAIDYAFKAGVLCTVDFKTPIPDPSFYQGVRVQPGHVAARLVFSRSTQTQAIVDSLKKRRYLLITGPSGAGKSALTWLAAHALTREMRWFQVSIQAGTKDATAIVRFVRARHPKKDNSIGLVLDDISSINGNSDLWNILANKFAGLPHVYLLGSIRQEDTVLITHQADTEFFTVNLDEDLAERFWKQLVDLGQTTWTHWCEPFEQSHGLMLEYVHLLTQGKRLASVIDEQVRQREREKRCDELALIRYTSALFACGGEVEAKKLCRLLGWESDLFSHALQRLLDEHIVRESYPGILGGLHPLRSNALRDASHDNVIHLPTDSLWHALLAATSETLPNIIQAMTKTDNEDVMLQKLAKSLEVSDDVEVWIAILTGLGLGTLERQATALTALLNQYEIPLAHHFLASFFADPNVDIPPLPGSTKHQDLQEAISAFRTLPKNDLRIACIKRLPSETHVPPWICLRQANRLLACLVPMLGGDAVQIALAPLSNCQGERNIQEVASLLSTAYLISPDMATQLVDALGGEQSLYDEFCVQMPWVTAPHIESRERHGRAIRADWFFIGGPYQTNPHENLERICKTLLALSPMSEVAASTALSPSKTPVLNEDGDHIPSWSQAIFRNNYPSQSSTVWNSTFRQIVLAKTTVANLTDFAASMTQFIQRTERVFHSFTKHWIGKEKIIDPHPVIDEMKTIVLSVNDLIYATSEFPVDRPDILLTSILGLAKKMNRKLNSEEAKSLATLAGDISAQIKKQGNSEIWRMTTSPPLCSLTMLEEHLKAVRGILHEMAYDDSPEAYARFAAVAKEGDGLRAVAHHCRAAAESRFRSRLRSLEEMLRAQGWDAQCRSRFVDQGTRTDWPATEIAILIKIADFRIDKGYIHDCFSAGQVHLRAEKWPFRVVPVMNGQVIVPLAALPSSQGHLRDEDFIHVWQPHIDLPFLTGENSDAFVAAVTACKQISSIVHCRDLSHLHPEEKETLAQVKDSFKRNRKIVGAFAENTKLDIAQHALQHIDNSWRQVEDEIEAIKAGQTIENPLYMCFYRGMDDDEINQKIHVIQMMMLQAEAGVPT